jgi:hypothetical protein
MTDPPFGLSSSSVCTSVDESNNVKRLKMTVCEKVFSLRLNTLLLSVDASLEELSLFELMVVSPPVEVFRVAEILVSVDESLERVCLFEVIVVSSPVVLFWQVEFSDKSMFDF